MKQTVWARPEAPAKQILFIPPFPSKIPPQNYGHRAGDHGLHAQLQ
jgi:hypothetical protein